ncbi:MAG: putative C-S lyase [Candidatus Rokuibacteriota bacterium]|nr:MAG: putative C-S lyase [Candidatus Rokubacteria bacterium]
MTYDFDRLVDRRHTDSSKWQKYGPDVLPLWVADMDFQSPEPVIRALRERVEHGVFGYLALEQPEFHELFADRLLKRYGWRVSPDAVVIIPGVIPGFNVAGRILAAPGDGLILQTPVYPPILRAASSIGLTREEAPLARRADGRYEVDLDAFSTAIGERTRFFLLCNPHNPVGRVLTRDDLMSLAQICLRRGLAIVADEIHCELTLGGRRHTPIASLDPEIADRTITLMAPSKTFNLAGLKCSVAVIPNAALREKFVSGRIDLVQTVNVFGYTAAFAAYRDGQPWLDELLRYLEANRDFVTEYVRTRLPGVAMFPPEATYLAWLDCRNASGASRDPFTFFLENARVALNDGTLFGSGGAGFVRLNFGCPRSLLAKALDRMREALTGDRAARV